MQRLRFVVTAVLISYSTAGWASNNGLRNVFLNGIDISSAKSQDLKHVDVHISESGDIFLVAPHYQVNEEDSFVPLSRYVQGLNQPVHQPMQKIESAVPGKPGPVAPAAAPIATAAPIPQPVTSGAAGESPNGAANGLTPKPGEPVPVAVDGPATPPSGTTPPQAAAPAPSGP